MTREDLKSCPFCGEQPEYRARVESPRHNSHWPEAVQCVGCGVLFRSGERNVTSAVDAWNTREGCGEMMPSAKGKFAEPAEPTYRPYDGPDEAWADGATHAKTPDQQIEPLRLSYRGAFVWLHNDAGDFEWVFVGYAALLKNYTKPDGTPCGIKETK